MSNYQFGDIKYYYEIHCAKQKALGNTPVSYARFTRRLQEMNLHDAIYTPRFKQKKKNRIEIPKPKKSLLDRFISLFK